MLKKTLIVIFILMLPVLYFLTQAKQKEKAKKLTISIYNEKASGVSLFFELLRTLDGTSISYNQKPIFYEKDLKPNRTLMILSPLGLNASTSSREQELIYDYVQTGGHLILSFHNEQTWIALQGLLSRFQLQVVISKDLSFVNRKTAHVVPPSDSRLFRNGETYQFYSNYLMNTEKCVNHNFECYVLEQPSGSGSVTVIAGLPYFSNGLIHLADNRKAAFRIAETAPILIDEYRHFFSNRTLFDLAMKPAFSVPLAGIFLAAILFFLLGHSPFHEKSLQDPVNRKSHLTMHGLNRNISLGFLKHKNSYSSALTTHIGFLKAAFPKKSGELAKISKHVAPYINKKSFLSTSSLLIKFHKRWISERGKK